jgi:iron complex outermembrane receptor protein
VQSYVSRQFAGDPATNRVGTRDFSDWPEKLVASLSWNLGPWSSTLTATVNGKIADSDKGWIQPKALFNVSGGYALSDNSKVSLILNNLAGSVPLDKAGGWPFYPTSRYSPHGRQGWIEFEHRFGG